MTAPRLRLAYASPWPPQSSGIADYSAELVGALAAHLDLTLYAEEPAAAALGFEAAGHGLPVRPLGELPARASEHDAVLYHLGNDPRFHGAIYRLLRRVPGLVVLHEFVLHHLVQGLTHGAGRTAEYVEALRYAYGPTGEALGRRFAESGIPLDPWAYPLFEPAVDAARGVIVHNRATRERILASRPDARVVQIPHHLSLDALPSGLDRAAARTALGIAGDVPVVASFGFMTPQKRLGVSLRAFAALRRTVPEAVFLVVGELAPDLRLDEDLAAASGVRVLGRVDLPTFLAAMLACDVAVNLRYPSGGETSGTLIRLLGLGKPVVVSDHGSFAEIPDGCCAKVPLDGDEEAVLAAVLERLCRDPDLRRAMGECARREMERHHTLAGSAAAYAAVVRQAVAEDWRPLPVVPPLAPYPRTDFGSALAGVVGAHLLDLGVEESDQDLLAAIAPAFVELGLDRG